MDRMFSLGAEKIAWLAGRPIAFILALGSVLLWAVLGPVFHYSDNWQLVINTGTTIVTFLMVFLIQNSQNRDIVAIHSKLNELILAASDARNEFVGLEHLTDREIEDVRKRLEAECHGRAQRCAPATPGDRKAVQREVTGAVLRHEDVADGRDVRAMV